MMGRLILFFELTTMSIARSVHGFRTRKRVQRVLFDKFFPQSRIFTRETLYTAI